jgi:hypothetical protein
MIIGGIEYRVSRYWAIHFFQYLPGLIVQMKYNAIIKDFRENI